MECELPVMLMVLVMISLSSCYGGAGALPLLLLLLLLLSLLIPSSMLWLRRGCLASSVFCVCAVGRSFVG